MANNRRTIFGHETVPIRQCNEAMGFFYQEAQQSINGN
ncbi:MAG: hypothetical protein UR60_C0018G0004 [Candidatus Moranbacteria bacterium GW2011_GWF2_34_56]|nr:MAG: hypothetical protein UR51_C0021G0004 [Candidatus Moranbacteria bacterium GW2011_GWF1_34_10]KKP64617.1 MAG: hypothetical protein UR60_C0018G0004 [Candidatus Moranbacteria bacterium GW2011_GWF2_34_56]